MFPKEWRLTRKRDIKRLFDSGKTTATTWFFIRYRPNSLGHPRFAVVVGRKVAKAAVVRNRLKRLVRQAIREQLAKTKPPSQDYLITIRRDPNPPYTLERVKPEVAQCFANSSSL